MSWLEESPKRGRGDPGPHSSATTGGWASTTRPMTTRTYGSQKSRRPPVMTPGLGIPSGGVFSWKSSGPGPASVGLVSKRDATILSPPQSPHGLSPNFATSATAFPTRCGLRAGLELSSPEGSPVVVAGRKGGNKVRAKQRIGAGSKVASSERAGGTRSAKSSKGSDQPRKERIIPNPNPNLNPKERGGRARDKRPNVREVEDLEDAELLKEDMLEGRRREFLCSISSHGTSSTAVNTEHLVMSGGGQQPLISTA
ncbi:unnamed protein product, partial [Choristocarpus tenellus]